MKDLLLFVHIEKAAGTTFHELLKQRLGNYFVLKPYPSHGDTLYPEQMADILSLAPFVTGFGGHRIKPYLDYEHSINRKVKYITILRDPVERFLSHYNHHVTRGIADYKLEEFLEIEYFHNFQTKKLAGNPSADEARHLIDSFYFAGTMDDVEKISGDRINNKGRYVLEKDEIDKKILEKIRDVNKEDIKLYEYVQGKKKCDIDELLKQKSEVRAYRAKDIYIKLVVQNLAFLKNKKMTSPTERGY